MPHEIHRVTTVKLVGGYTLEVGFADGSVQIIDLEPVLAGELYGPLGDPALFAQVKIDPEVATLVWPNGADFDPDTLYHWQTYGPLMARAAQKWAAVAS